MKRFVIIKKGSRARTFLRTTTVGFLFLTFLLGQKGHLHDVTSKGGISVVGSSMIPYTGEPKATSELRWDLAGTARYTYGL